MSPEKLHSFHARYRSLITSPKTRVTVRTLSFSGSSFEVPSGKGHGHPQRPSCTTADRKLLHQSRYRSKSQANLKIGGTFTGRTHTGSRTSRGPFRISETVICGKRISRKSVPRTFRQLAAEASMHLRLHSFSANLQLLTQ